MRILDNKENVITRPDFKKGRLIPERRVVKVHEKVNGVPEEGHWETVAVYPNGGKEVKWVIDVEVVEAKEAWTEYENVLRYIEYTNDELDERNQLPIEKRLDAIESQMETIMLLLTDNTRKDDA